MDRENLKEVVKIFINKWDTTEGMWKNSFLNEQILNNFQYKGFKIKISYGHSGNRVKLPRKPWIAFLKDENKVSKGIYPFLVYNYDIQDKNIEVGLGTSEDKKPDIDNYILREINNYKRKSFDINDLDNIVNYLDKSIDTFEQIISNKYNTTNNKIKNIILYGAPGVGKTHNINRLISLIEEGKSDVEIFESLKENEYAENIDISAFKNRVKFVTFHQSFGYEDFIEGFRPNEEGKIELVDGIFKNVCQKAKENSKQNYYLIIDEINRGNISKIFGELITLIEEDKRDTLEVILPYSKTSLKVPSNLYIIGTMNSTDKSIALIDIALRRRFTFIKMKPNSKLIEYQKAKEIFESLNEYISNTIGNDFKIGHSYFMKIQNDDELDFVLEYKIKPLLEEYYYGNSSGLEEVLAMTNL